jgi:CRP-like cAMP-binding protein
MSRSPAKRTNLLFNSLSDASRRRLEPHVRYMELDRGEVVFRPGEAVRRVIFPFVGTMASLLVVDEDGTGIEAGVVGCEGIVGIQASLGNVNAAHQCVIQIAGDAVSVPAEVLAWEFERDPSIQKRILRYIAYLLAQISHTALCNRLHPADERLARWLLMCQDRAQTNELYLTHELLAQMLGTRRATVSLSAGALQAAGLIRYVHGKLTIIDRAGLLSTTCSCYDALRRFEREYINNGNHPE